MREAKDRSKEDNLMNRDRKKRKKLSRPESPLQLKWEFDPNIPTSDFFAGQRPEDRLGEAIEDFIFIMEQDEFLAWEAVMAQEQGLRLTRRQQAALKELVSLNDAGDDDILYINETPRPSEPWYSILNKIVPHLLVEPFRTFDVHWEEQHEGWRRLVQCLNEHADGLSLPAGVSSPVEVVPTELRHKLWLQDCMDALSGLGQDEELTLQNEEQREFRMAEFVESLREHKDSVRYFALTLDSLLTKVIVPEKDKPILTQMMQELLGMNSTADLIAEYL
jgi:hypothetical protein